MAIILTSLALWIICGFLSRDLQIKKGYDSGFWIGFVLGIFGLIYSAGLPVVDKKRNNKNTKTGAASENKDNSSAVDYEEFAICKHCGFQIFADEDKCSNCGKPKK